MSVEIITILSLCFFFTVIDLKLKFFHQFYQSNFCILHVNFIHIWLKNMFIEFFSYFMVLGSKYIVFFTLF